MAAVSSGNGGVAFGGGNDDGEEGCACQRDRALDSYDRDHGDDHDAPQYRLQEEDVPSRQML